MGLAEAGQGRAERGRVGYGGVKESSMEEKAGWGGEG